MTAALLVLASVGSITACGDDDDDGGGGGSGSGGSEQLSKAEFIEQADDICKDFTDATEDLTDPEEEDEVLPYLEDALELLDETESKFAALDPPADGEEVHEAQLGTIREFQRLFNEARDLAEGGDVPGAIALLDGADPGAESDELVKDYGFKDCAE